jgi:hypothetical protein
LTYFNRIPDGSIRNDGLRGIDAKRLNFIQSQLYYFEIDKLLSHVVKVEYAPIYVESGF